MATGYSFPILCNGDIIAVINELGIVYTEAQLIKPNPTEVPSLIFDAPAVVRLRRNNAIRRGLIIAPVDAHQSYSFARCAMYFTASSRS